MKILLWLLFSSSFSFSAQGITDKVCMNDCRLRGDVTRTCESKCFYSKKAKLVKGLKKSQVISMFGSPATVGANGRVFSYSSYIFCQPGDPMPLYGCDIEFDENNQVKKWYYFLPKFTSDAED